VVDVDEALRKFPIASRFGDRVLTLTGTPSYQMPDKDTTDWDASTDLFAVGVTLYELLCNGEHPYKGGKPMASGAVQDPGVGTYAALSVDGYQLPYSDQYGEERDG
jgi:serine/threonine protein kinase